MDINKNLYIDTFGHIAQDHPKYDGGDSFSFAGQVMIARYFQIKNGYITNSGYGRSEEMYRQQVDSCETSWGYFARHPDKERWASSRGVMSRDQMSANIIAMGFTKMKGHLRRMMLRHLLFRGGLFAENYYYNNDLAAGKKVPDITGPKIWAMYIRAWACINPRATLIFWPLLWLLDIQLAVDSVLSVVMDDPNETNHIGAVLQANVVMPTLLSKLSCWLLRLKPRHSKDPYSDDYGPQSALNAFFEGRNNIEPKINREYMSILELELTNE